MKTKSNKKISKVKDIFGIFKKELANVDTDKELKKVKKELWPKKPPFD